MSEPAVADSYPQFLAELRGRIRSAQLRASLAVNRELVLLYWQIGRDILERQARESWGAKVIERLATDLKRAFPEMKGFSPRNLKYMRAFAEAWPEEAIVQAVLAQITWYHNLAILEKLAGPGERLWYARAAIQHGWSRNVLVHQIESGRLSRQGKAVANFDRTLPAPQSDLARDITKDPYNFDFLTLGEDARERDLEGGLLDHCDRSEELSDAATSTDALKATGSPAARHKSHFHVAHHSTAQANCPLFRRKIGWHGKVMAAKQMRALPEAVTIDKEVMHGTPCFAQTRVPVQTLIDFLETGETIDDFLAVYPSVPRQHVCSFLELSRDIAIDQLACASL